MKTLVLLDDFHLLCFFLCDTISTLHNNQSRSDAFLPEATSFVTAFR